MRKILPISIIFWLLCLSTCQRDTFERFLKIESLWFTVADFHTQYPIHNFKHLPEEYKKRRIEAFIDRQLVVYKGIDDNYPKRDEFKAKFRNFRNRLLINIYFDRTVLDSVITKRKLLDSYESLDFGKREMYTFDEYADVLKERLIRKFSNEIQERYLAEVQRLKHSSGFQSYPEHLEQMAQIYLDRYITLRNDTASYSSIDILKRLDFSKPLFQIGGKDIYLKKFITMIENYPLALPNQFSSPQVLNEIVETVAVNTYTLELSKKLRLHRDPDFKQRLRDEKFTLLHYFVLRDEVSRKISINDDSLYQYYLDHTDSLYRSETRYEVQEIYVYSRQQAKEIIQKLDQGADFQHLSNLYTKRYLNKPRKGYLGLIRSNMYGSIGHYAAKTPAGGYYPEPIPSGNGFSVIKVLSIDESKPIPFEQIRSNVLEDYRKSCYNRKKAELIQKLRDKYHYIVDYSKLII